VDKTVWSDPLLAHAAQSAVAWVRVSTRRHTRPVVSLLGSNSSSSSFPSPWICIPGAGRRLPSWTLPVRLLSTSRSVPTGVVVLGSRPLLAHLGSNAGSGLAQMVLVTSWLASHSHQLMAPVLYLRVLLLGPACVTIYSYYLLQRLVTARFTQ